MTKEDRRKKKRRIKERKEPKERRKIPITIEELTEDEKIELFGGKP